IDLQTYRGLAYYKKGDYVQAKRCYQEVLQLSQAITWQRMIILARLYLAYIAIAQKQFNEAEILLETGLPVVDNNTDKRLSALYRQAFAQIYSSKGKVSEAQIWAKQALDGFEYLGMKAEAEETREMLHALQE
ncbi:MAG TPA: tetratricopeptide repeat protein, partial [Ktedonobacteraceae bacterium]